jgi:hypothetical protein
MKRVTWMVALTLLGVAGCKPGASDQSPKEPAPAAPVAMAEAATNTPAPLPCTLLADASVARAVPQAQPGKQDDSDQEYGVSACRWSVADGAVALQVMETGPGGLPHELRAASLEIVDVHRADAASLVRLEAFAGIADRAGAFVEHEDAKRGIRKAGAVLMVQHRSRLAVLRIPQLAQGDRNQALATLKTLGAEIAKGL